jgi:hypothetical protein
MKSPGDKKVTTEDLEALRDPAAGTEAIAKVGKSEPGARSGNGSQEPELSPLFTEDVQREFRTNGKTFKQVLSMSRATRWSRRINLWPS